VGRDSLKAEADVVAQLDAVAVGEDTPGKEAYADAADLRPPHVQSGVTVVLVLEDDEEVLWAVSRDLDVPV
jgi:hypothetical protein